MPFFVAPSERMKLTIFNNERPLSRTIRYVLRGASRLADISGQPAYDRNAVISLDDEAIGEDWHMVGRDIADAIETYGRSTRQPESTHRAHTA
jgi:hypothetical protein